MSGRGTRIQPASSATHSELGQQASRLPREPPEGLRIESRRRETGRAEKRPDGAVPVELRHAAPSRPRPALRVPSGFSQSIRSAAPIASGPRGTTNPVLPVRGRTRAALPHPRSSAPAFPRERPRAGRNPGPRLPASPRRAAPPRRASRSSSSSTRGEVHRIRLATPSSAASRRSRSSSGPRPTTSAARPARAASERTTQVRPLPCVEAPDRQDVVSERARRGNAPRAAADGREARCGSRCTVQPLGHRLRVCEDAPGLRQPDAVDLGR